MLRERSRQLQDYLAARPRLKGAARVVPFLAIGPISGPLLAGVIFSFKEGRPVRGSMYALALVEYVILLPTLVAKLGAHLL